MRLAFCGPLEAGAPRPRPPRLGEGASPAALERDVRYLAESLGPRGQRHPASMRQAANHIARAFAAAGGRVERQPTPVGAPPFTNVVARFGPAGLPLRVVGAHYDSFRDTAGADDDASGVAGLLELARLLGATHLEAPVELVAYANEEPPHFRTNQMGSAVHARTVAASARVVVLEMIGYFSSEPGSQEAPSRALAGRIPDVGDFVVVVGRSEDEEFARAVRDALALQGAPPVYAFTAPPTRPGIDHSDHRSYWPRDIPAVMVTDTAFLRNHAYHTERDTPEALDYERMAAVVDGVFVWLTEG
ncbi:MAG: hypothetical protein CMN30_00465 [Sandaracinus sp.]|nr:hypothetical protein [Sandaracinus sp.]